MKTIKMSNAPSARSKKMDQLYLAKDELDDNERAALTRGVAAAEFVFETVARVLFAGTRNWKRLVKQSARHKQTPLAYTQRVLLK